MSEVDYQMALLLQYKFEQEHKSKQSTDSDQQLALELQQQFEAEAQVEQPKNNLVYKVPQKSNSKCLVDPSWEVIDPTPDIHVLFMAFNKKFFWDTLGSVTVSWSKRMTRCAGICSYQGRGGMCSITLSEPLLKLRPRKDLVETLLHEMIHAYLFVTNNNRDRDGHGPEFHKHMYRINAEAGTNITVYHDFHDEVNLYLQHWWRCNGPCRTQKPWYGTVKRAIDRTPGPNDRWWSEHQRNCGGTFIKVKSPNKPAKAESKTSNKNNKKPSKLQDSSLDSTSDIRKYFPTSSNSSTSKPSQSNKENETVSNNIPRPKSTSSLTNNIHTVTNNTNGTPKVSSVIPKANNIFGFTNLNGSTANSSGTQKWPGGISGVKGAIKNAGSSTFVVSKKRGKSLGGTDEEVLEKPSTSTSNVQAFSGTGRTLSNGSISSLSSNDYSIVRNHWLKRFENSNQNKGSVKRSKTDMPSTSQKVPRLSNSENSESKNTRQVECPICKNSFKEEDLNQHLDTCLESQNDVFEECIICGTNIPVSSFEIHVAECSAKHFNDDFEDKEDVSYFKQCPACFKNIIQKSYTEHVENCKPKSDKPHDSITSETKNCPICKESLSHVEYDIHYEKCLLKMFDAFDQKYDNNKDCKTLCLACNKEILKSELNLHLEDCMSISNVLDSSCVVIDDDDNSDVEDCDKDVKNNNYNCPVCLKIILENEMMDHLDLCLKTEECTD